MDDVLKHFLHLCLTTSGSNKLVRKECEFFVPFKHILKALFVGIPKVQEQALSENRKCTIVVHGW